MKIARIGNGGAFDYESTNSSFLLENDNSYLLVDCGYSVFAELRKRDAEGIIDLKLLEAVYITHLDDDHVGSLKTLLFYCYFILGNSIVVYCGSESIKNELAIMLKDMNKVYNKGTVEKVDMVGLVALNPLYPVDVSGMRLNATPTQHHTEGYGLTIEAEDDDEYKCVFISGDTVATPEIRFIMEEIIASYGSYKIYHDFSDWDCIDKQVHACEEGFKKEYKGLESEIYKYHNNQPIPIGWLSI